MPQDNTVNGYRINQPTLSSSNITEKAESHNGLYYANTETKKFHFSGCKSADKINDDNLYITEFRDELTEKGYTPCGICNP